jgi:hypothetical protein
MVLRLAERLDLPLRERNTWLVAAGYAPLYAERRWPTRRWPPARAAMEPCWRARALAGAGGGPALAPGGAQPPGGAAAGRRGARAAVPPVNVLRLTLHPEGLAPMIEGLGAWRAHVLARLARQAAASGDAALARLHDEMPPCPRRPRRPRRRLKCAEDAVAVPLVLHTPYGRLAFLGTVTVFGAPARPALSELAIETLLPADAATAAALHALAAPAAAA